MGIFSAALIKSSQRIQVERLILLNRVSVHEQAFDARWDEPTDGLLAMALETLLAHHQVLWHLRVGWHRNVARDFNLRCFKLPQIELELGEREPE